MADSDQQADNGPLRDDVLWTTDDLAAYYRCSDKTAYRIAAKPGHPKPRIIGGRRRYIPSEIKAYVERLKD